MSASAQRLPPVTELAITSLALIVAAGIYLAANLPHHVSLTPAVILLALSAALVAFNCASLLRVPGFAWDRFRLVGKWALLAYLIEAGLILFVFVRNHVGGGTLIVLILSLAVFAVHVPLLIGFTVARTPALPTGDSPHDH